jgi:DNA-binding transcriptional regulator YiaG
LVVRFDGRSIGSFFRARNIKNALAMKKPPLYIRRMNKANPIATLRERFRLSQVEMAERLGITSRTLRELERQDTVPLRYELAAETLRVRLMKEIVE